MSKHLQQRHAGPMVVGRGQLRRQVARDEDHLGVAGEQGQHGLGPPVPKENPVLQERLDLAGDAVGVGPDVDRQLDVGIERSRSELDLRVQAL